VLKKAQENSEIAAKILLQQDSLNRRSTAPEAEGAGSAEAEAEAEVPEAEGSMISTIVSGLGIWTVSVSPVDMLRLVVRTFGHKEVSKISCDL